MESKVQVRVCNKCGHPVTDEVDPFLRKEYPFYCPECDENLYGIETRLEEKQDGR